MLQSPESECVTVCSLAHNRSAPNCMGEVLTMFSCIALLAGGRGMLRVSTVDRFQGVQIFSNGSFVAWS